MNLPFITIEPFSLEKNYGQAANSIIDHLPDNTWIICKDVDGMIITPTEHYGHLVKDAITYFPDTGLFTCFSQRTKNVQQSYKGLIDENGDMSKHRTTAKQLIDVYKEYASLNQQKANICSELTHPISGFWMLFNKNTWSEVGGFNENGCLSVDNQFSYNILKAGKPIRRINHLLFLHYYRLNESLTHTKHLK